MVKISWTTATEKNNNYFTVEKSKDGINWTVVQKINGAGNSNQLIDYSITDPASDDIYYRLTQTDYDGKFEIFPPIPVECKNYSNIIKVYPNPTSNTLNINSQNTIIEIELVDIFGQTILKINHGSDAIDLSDFPSGIYTLRIKDDQNKINIFKIVKR